MPNTFPSVLPTLARTADDRAPEFRCFLADQPEYLVPDRLLSHGHSSDYGGPLVVNPNAWFTWRESMPAAIENCYPLPEKFRGNTGMIWVDDPLTGMLTPFWTGPWFQGKLAGLTRGNTVPALSLHQRSVLSQAGVLVSPGDSSRRSAAWKQQFLNSTRNFQNDGFAQVHGLIHPFLIGSLRRYYRHLLRSGGMTLGDSGCPRRYVAYNESVAQFFHKQIAPVVSSIAGVEVRPSFVYVGSYLEGSDLPEHTDRAQCEYAITLLIDYTPEPVDQSPWPFYIKTSKGTIRIWQGIGDATIYRGTQLSHYRKQLAAGATSTSIFFYYVDENFAGPLG